MIVKETTEQRHAQVLKTIGEKLEELREEKQMNYCQFSGYLGMQQFHLTQIMRGRKTPKLYTLVQICSLADVPLKWLLGLSDVRDKLDIPEIFGMQAPEIGTAHGGQYGQEV